jgi:pimeloyl-ACP methyl ester carboxylesterase
MYRTLISLLAKNIHVIASDYIGFGYGDARDAADFSYTFDNLATHVEGLLFGVLDLKKFSIYVQGYGGPVGYRIASKHPQAIDTVMAFEEAIDKFLPRPESTAAGNPKRSQTSSHSFSKRKFFQS